jgi:hypothetical protein
MLAAITAAATAPQDGLRLFPWRRAGEAEHLPDFVWANVAWIMFVLESRRAGVQSVALAQRGRWK